MKNVEIFKSKIEIQVEKYYEAIDAAATEFMVDEENFDSFALALASLKFSYKAFKFYELQMLNNGQKLPGDFIKFCKNAHQAAKQ